MVGEEKGKGNSYHWVKIGVVEWTTTGYGGGWDELGTTDLVHHSNGGKSHEGEPGATTTTREEILVG